MARTPTEIRLPDGTVAPVRVVHPRDMPVERPLNEPTIGLVWSTLLAGGGSDE